MTRVQPFEAEPREGDAFASPEPLALVNLRFTSQEAVADKPRRLLPARLRVRSSSDPATVYLLVVNPSGTVTCSCLAGWHRRTCRHARMVAS